MPRAHIEKVSNIDASLAYVQKEDTRLEGPWEYGTKPVKRNSAKDWQEVWDNAVKGNIDKIDPEVRVKHYANLQRIRKDHMVLQDAEGLRGVWIWGESGIGKSRKARADYPNAYPKLCNKWWDGYQGEANVIMDDMGLDHKCLGQQLKIWADRYGCILETKGGAIPSQYAKFVVTSQYEIDDIFEDEKTREALKRRFTVIHMSDPFGV